MEDVTIDFETMSEVDLRVVGRAVYMAHPSTRIQLMAYKVGSSKTMVWQPGQPTPDIFGNQLVAFNAPFERDCISILGSKHHGWPIVTLENFVDVQALCGRYGLPQNLADASAALDTPVKKMKEGSDLIKIFCAPPYGRDANGHILASLQDKWAMFVQYCRDDVDLSLIHI